MFNFDREKESDEYSRLAWLLAINDRILQDISEKYDAGIGDSPLQVIESSILSGEEAKVPPSILMEYRTILVKYGERLRSDISQFRRVKVAIHELETFVERKDQAHPVVLEPKAKKVEAPKRKPGGKKAGRKQGAGGS